MKEMALQGVTRGNKKTTHADPALPCPEDKVNRDFKAPAPNILWGASINIQVIGFQIRCRRFIIMISLGFALLFCVFRFLGGFHLLRGQIRWGPIRHRG